MSSVLILENHYRTFPHVKTSWCESHKQQLPLVLGESKRKGKCNLTAHVDWMKVKRKSLADRLELSKWDKIYAGPLDWLKLIQIEEKQEHGEKQEQVEVKLDLLEKEKIPTTAHQEPVVAQTSPINKPVQELTETKKKVIKQSKESIKERLKKNPLFRFHYYV